MCDVKKPFVQFTDLAQILESAEYLIGKAKHKLGVLRATLEAKEIQRRLHFDDEVDGEGKKIV